MLERITRRLPRFLRLDHRVYHEIADDDRATLEAALIALLAAALSGVGGLLTRGPLEFLTWLVAGVLVNWLLWSFVARVVGAVAYHSVAPWAQVARVLGYAVAPLALGLFGFLGFGLRLVAWALSLYYGFFAVREVMGLRTEAAVVTIATSSLAVLAINAAVQLLL
ncbi:MAG: hypothetical protein GX649_16390 [Chloroflexi bacterium]|nr:hypothetical protein [Chloroflexota bacterium]